MNGIDDDDLARILRSEEPLTPSSGFTAAVMESVHEAATEPSPLPFPWLRLATAAIACAVGAAATVPVLASIDWSAITTTGASLQAAAPELAYATTAALASLLILRLPRLRRA